MNLSRRSLSMPNHSRLMVLRNTVKYKKATCNIWAKYSKGVSRESDTVLSATLRTLSESAGRMSASLTAKSACVKPYKFVQSQESLHVALPSRSVALYLKSCFVCMPEAIEDALPQSFQVLLCQVVLL